MMKNYVVTIMLLSLTSTACYAHTLPLFNSYPTLTNSFHHLSLGSFPTPVQHLCNLETHLNINKLYIKRDDQCGGTEHGKKQLGTNKVRSLEFFLADAQSKGAKTIITSGSAGSNQALMTAIYAHHIGLTPYILLYQQPPSETVQRNLLMLLHYDTRLFYFKNAPGQLEICLKKAYAEALAKDGIEPYHIRTSGSEFPGLIGFVNAGFELKKQVDNGDLPEPDLLYITCATMGSAAGIMVGVRAAGLKTRVVAVTVKNKVFDSKKILAMSKRINNHIHAIDASFPLLEWNEHSFEVTHDFLAPGYALASPESQEAIQLMNNYEGIQLDNTYTGKTFAAIIRDAHHGRLCNKTVLFWFTFPTDPCEDLIHANNYRNLPQEFHHYFTT